MPHYRLLKADSADSRGICETDKPDQEAALLDFEQQLGVPLSLNGDEAAAPDYLMQSRTNQPDFSDSEKLPVYCVTPEA